MAAPQRFRTALRGLNREDVVSYIEYLNNQHRAKVEQLQNQLEEANNRASKDDTQQLQAQLDAALARCKELEKSLAGMEADVAEKELEAYRRAERTERQAKERARILYERANNALQEATEKAEAAAEEIGQIAGNAVEQLKAYQDSITATAENFRAAVASLQAAKPEEE